MIQNLPDKTQKFDILGVQVSAVNMDEAVRFVGRTIEDKRKSYVSVCPVSTIMACQEDENVRRAVNAAELVTPDGMPTVWIGKSKGFKAMSRVYGPDFLLAVCALSVEKGYSHYFYGATDEVLAKMADNLKQKFPGLNIAGYYAPPFRNLTETEQRDVIDRINGANPDVIWVGLGSPKQDLWMAENQPLLNAPVLAGVGAAFDFHAGTKKQAPAWMQNVGLEWLFRLCCEPRRLWRRYLIGNTKFIWLLMLSAFGRKEKGNIA